MFPSASLAVGCAPVLATAVLLLATSRAWRARRAFVEAILLAAGLLFATAWLAPRPLPLAQTLLPVAALISVWGACAYGAWRFAPDCGQRGFTWVFRASAPRVLPWSLGASLALTPLPWRCTGPLPLLFVTGLLFLAMLGLGGACRTAARIATSFRHSFLP